MSELRVELTPGGAKLHGHEPGGTLRPAASVVITTRESELRAGVTVIFKPEDTERSHTDLAETQEMCREKGYELIFREDGTATLRKL